MPMISLKDVTKVYHEGARPALNHINLDIDRGEFVFLVGASGSGKTTLLQLLLREQEATEGEIHVAGNDLRRMPNRLVPRYRRMIGFVFQDYKLLPGKTVWENVAFALEVIGARRSTIRTLVPQVLKTVGLTGKENRFPHELSGGEAQRVAIARAYVNHPQILLADEPTGNLDPTTSIGIMEILNSINTTGNTTVVMATHNEEIVNAMHKRVIELNKGDLVRDEANGMYDSSLYYPDRGVKGTAERSTGSALSHASVAADAVEAVPTLSSLAAMAQSTPGAEEPRQSGQSERSGRGEQAQASEPVPETPEEKEARREQEQKENDVILASGGDPGIARLAKSVHSGGGGRYTQAFQPVEETLTWGMGMGDRPAPSASGKSVSQKSVSGKSRAVKPEASGGPESGTSGTQDATSGINREGER